MKTATSTQVGTSSITTQELKAQSAQYLAQQPASKQTFHKWMKAMEMASLAIVAGAFAVALYISINWTAFPKLAIPTAWIAFPVSFVPFLLLSGVEAIVLRAVLRGGVHAPGFRVVVPFAPRGKRQELVTGSKAVASGWGLVVTAVAAGAFWGTLAWAVWTFDLALVGTYMRILGTALGVVIVLSIALSFYQKLVRAR
jgi:hypothetical protein